MPDLVLTLLLAFVVSLLAVAGLGIGWLLKGKPLKRGCGQSPKMLKDSDCGENKTCPLCDPSSHKDKKGRKAP